MAEQLLYPEWRAENEGNRYPFAETATLTAADGTLLLDGTFLDACLYPVGGDPAGGLYLARADVANDAITLWLGDQVTGPLASAAFSPAAPPALLAFADALGRPAGVLVSEPDRLAALASWAVGMHAFTPAQTEFAACVCVPTPEVGLRGLALADGGVLAGDVWLVGGDGVVLRADELFLPAGCGRGGRTLRAVRVDVVGDPLYRRRLCTPQALFATPRFIRKIRLVGGDGSSVELTPDAGGQVYLVANDAAAPDTVLRVAADEAGLRIETVGD